jgi:hypothetical protein
MMMDGVQSSGDTKCCEHFAFAWICWTILGLCRSWGYQIHFAGDVCNLLWLCLPGNNSYALFKELASI